MRAVWLVAWVLGCQVELAETAPPEDRPTDPAPPVTDSVAQRVQARVRALMRHPWSHWATGVTVVRGFVPHGRGAGIAEYLQPDLTYEVVAAGKRLVRHQEVDGKVVTQELPMHPEEGLPRAFTGSDPPEVAATFDLDGAAVPSVLRTQPGVSHDHSVAPAVTRQWTLMGDDAVLLRSETTAHGKPEQLGHWWALVRLDRPKTIDGVVYLCIETRRRTGDSDAYAIVTTFLSPEVPGHVVEEVIEYFKVPDHQRPWMVTVEKVLRIGR